MFYTSNIHVVHVIHVSHVFHSVHVVHVVHVFLRAVAPLMAAAGPCGTTQREIVAISVELSGTLQYFLELPGSQSCRLNVSFNNVSTIDFSGNKFFVEDNLLKIYISFLFS